MGNISCSPAENISRNNNLLSALFIVSLYEVNYFPLKIFQKILTRATQQTPLFKQPKSYPLLFTVNTTSFSLFPCSVFLLILTVFFPNLIQVCKNHQYFSKGCDGHLYAITRVTFSPSIFIALSIPHNLAYQSVIKALFTEQTTYIPSLWADKAKAA